MARLTDEIVNGQRMVHVEDEDEFYDYCDRGPITLSHELADSLGFREHPGSVEELHAEEREELQKEWAEEERRAEHPMDPSSPFSEDEHPLAVVIPFPTKMR